MLPIALLLRSPSTLLLQDQTAAMLNAMETAGAQVPISAHLARTTSCHLLWEALVLPNARRIHSYLSMALVTLVIRRAKAALESAPVNVWNATLETIRSS